MGSDWSHYDPIVGQYFVLEKHYKQNAIFRVLEYDHVAHF